MENALIINNSNKICIQLDGWFKAKFKSDSVGGVWSYSPDPLSKHATPMYQNLHTNVPIESMGMIYRLFILK